MADPTARAEALASDFRAALLAHYGCRRRDLPWRGERDPYRILVSEVMLQQTRVETVIPFYRRWLERFPDLGALAGADLEEVLEAWKGLGYYARARNLHRAARLVRDRHGGQVPADPGALGRLPGVGDYTAGAVASMAHGVAVPAVDGNARRVLARVFDLEDPGAAQLQDLAGALLDTERPGAFNQALMELGATLCSPRRPQCARCPVARICLARERGTVERRPRRRRRRDRPHVELGVAVVVGAGGATFLVRRPPQGLLGGLWEFPAGQLRPGESPLAAARRAARGAGHRPRSRPAPLAPVEHAFSHLRATYHPFLFRVRAAAGRAPRTDEPEGAWTTLAEAAEWALPAAQERIRRAAAAEVDGAGARRERAPRLSSP